MVRPFRYKGGKGHKSSDLAAQKLQSHIFHQYHNSGLGGGHHAHHHTWLRIKQDW